MFWGMMKKFEFLDHTSEAKFRAYGKTVEEAFSNAALALYNVFVDTETINGKIKKKIKAEGTDMESLLLNFLDQFIILVDSENFLLKEVKKIKIIKKEKYKIEAEVIGDKYSEKYETHGALKAVTYNDMLIKKEKNGYMVQVVVDI